MEEFDLQNIWKQADQSADQFFEEIAPELEKKARGRSISTIDKVLRNASIELIFTCVLGVFVFFIPNLSVPMFWAFVIANAIAIPTALHVYLRLYQRIKTVNQSSLKKALEEKINILQSFVKRLELLTYILLPIGFCLGLGVSVLEDFDVKSTYELIKRFFIVLFISAPFLILIVWFFKKKYIYWLYGQHLEGLKNVYYGLIKGEEEV